MVGSCRGCEPAGDAAVDLDRPIHGFIATVGRLRSVSKEARIASFHGLRGWGIRQPLRGQPRYAMPIDSELQRSHDPAVSLLRGGSALAEQPVREDAGAADSIAMCPR